MDQLSIDYAQEALREFSVYAERVREKHYPEAQLVIFGDGSGHIQPPIGESISFFGLDMLVKLLVKKNHTKDIRVSMRLGQIEE